MSLNTMSNFTNQQSSLRPTYVFYETYVLILTACCSNARQSVGDGADSTDVAPSLLAVCHLEGNDDMYYYSTTFSGGPGVCLFLSASRTNSSRAALLLCAISQ